MTGVYSGGLVYEYSEEGSGYGLVTISGDSVTNVGSQFTDLQSALKSNPAPTGNGGARSSGSASTCPPSSDEWNIEPFTSDNLPAVPSGVDTFFKNGAGTGPGLAGSGSQNAGGGSSGTATPGSGSATVYATQAGSTGKTTSKGAASSLVVPPFEYGSLATVVVALFSTFAGAYLL